MLSRQFIIRTERLFGLGGTKLEFKWDGVPTNWQQKVAKTIQKAYNSDKKRLSKYAKCEVRYAIKNRSGAIVL